MRVKNDHRSEFSNLSNCLKTAVQNELFHLFHINIFQLNKTGESMLIYQHTGLNGSGSHINFVHLF